MKYYHGLRGRVVRMSFFTFLSWGKIAPSLTPKDRLFSYSLYAARIVTSQLHYFAVDENLKNDVITTLVFFSVEEENAKVLQIVKCFHEKVFFCECWFFRFSSAEKLGSRDVTMRAAYRE